MKLVVGHTWPFEERKDNFAALVISDYPKRVVNHGAIRQGHVMIEDAALGGANKSNLNGSHRRIRNPPPSFIANTGTQASGP